MPHPTSDSAYGIWSLNEVRDAVRGENWPGPRGPFIGADTLVSSGSDTELQLGNGFTFPISASTGYIVVAFASRTDAGVDSYSVSDSAGNTYTRVLEGTQPNGLTVSAVFYAPVTSSVTSGSTTLTISTTGSSTTETGVAFFNVTEFTGTVSSQTPQDVTGTLSESINMPGGGGFVVHVIGTGLSSPLTGLSSSTGYIKLLEYAQTGSSTYVFYDEQVGGPTTNTISINSGNWSSVMAGFYT